MWVTTTTPQSLLPTPISFPKLPQPPATTVQLRRRNRHLAVACSADDIGGLGQALFSALESGQEPKPSNKGNEISGSDILRAMQKASAKKASNKKQQKKKKGSSELKNEKTNKKVVDFDKVRPITIKSDWATRLTDLEKRLQQFSLLLLSDCESFPN